jgi:hypothetical protein
MANKDAGYVEEESKQPAERGEFDENIIDVICIIPDFCHGFSNSLGPGLDDGKL